MKPVKDCLSSRFTVPSWLAHPEIRISKRGSRLAVHLKGFLQQNRHTKDTLRGRRPGVVSVLSQSYVNIYSSRK
jgi:hypothetical protein